LERGSARSRSVILGDSDLVLVEMDAVGDDRSRVGARQAEEALKGSGGARAPLASRRSAASRRREREGPSRGRAERGRFAESRVGDGERGMEADDPLDRSRTARPNERRTRRGLASPRRAPRSAPSRRSRGRRAPRARAGVARMSSDPSIRFAIRDGRRSTSCRRGAPRRTARRAAAWRIFSSRARSSRHQRVPGSEGSSSRGGWRRHSQRDQPAVEVSMGVHPPGSTRRLVDGRARRAGRSNTRRRFRSLRLLMPPCGPPSELGSELVRVSKGLEVLLPRLRDDLVGVSRRGVLSHRSPRASRGRAACRRTGETSRAGTTPRPEAGGVGGQRFVDPGPARPSTDRFRTRTSCPR